MSATVRINQSAWQALKLIAFQTGEPMQAVLDKAIEAYRRQYFLQKANNAYEALRENTEAWQEEIKEREAWDDTLGDGLKEI
ncbi:MAG: Uncharacterized protein XD78_0834 [Desulfotomaculum sp. 46_296]|nr:MAG: Uncharacterized protein XD78_0834 [Desulfotomaculum sp. 46_296]HAU32061.1 toxin-antitoxin system protein [Desulfotomaculum sp.]